MKNAFYLLSLAGLLFLGFSLSMREGPVEDKLRSPAQLSLLLPVRLDEWGNLKGDPKQLKQVGDYLFTSLMSKYLVVIPVQISEKEWEWFAIFTHFESQMDSKIATLSRFFPTYFRTSSQQTEFMSPWSYPGMPDIMEIHNYESRIIFASKRLRKSFGLKLLLEHSYRIEELGAGGNYIPKGFSNYKCILTNPAREENIWLEKLKNLDPVDKQLTEASQGLLALIETPKMMQKDYLYFTFSGQVNSSAPGHIICLHYEDEELAKAALDPVAQEDGWKANEFFTYLTLSDTHSQLLKDSGDKLIEWLYDE